MTETLRTLERALSGLIADEFASKTTSIGDDNKDMNDTALADVELGTNSFENYWAEIVSQQNTGNIRRVSASTSVQLTVTRAFRGDDGILPKGTDYFLHQFHPSLKIKAINEAIQETYKDLYDHVIDESNVINNIGRNNSFDNHRAMLIADASTDDADVGSPASLDDLFTSFSSVTLIAEVVSFSDNNGTIMAKQDGNEDNAWALWTTHSAEADGARINFEHTRSGTRGIWRTAMPVLPHNKLCWVAVSYAAFDVSNEPSMYLKIEDGYWERVALSEISTPTGTVGLDAGSNLIFGNREDGTDLWNGMIGEMQIWGGGALSLDQLESVTDKRDIDFGYREDLPQLVGRWIPSRGADDAGSNGLMNDVSGNANNATVTMLWQDYFDYWIPIDLVAGNPAATAQARSLGLDDKVHGSSAMYLLAASGGATFHRQYIASRLASGTQLKCHRWVRADAATSARIGIGGDTGVTTLFSAYHSGNGKWELLTAEYTLTDNDVGVYQLIEAATSLNGMFGFGWITLDAVSHYKLPDRMEWPSFVSVQIDQLRPDGPFVSMNNRTPLSGMIIRIEGKRPFKELGFWTDEINITPDRARLLLMKAEERFYTNLSNSIRSGDLRKSYSDAADKAAVRYADNVSRLRMPNLGAEVPKNWTVEGNELIVNDLRQASVVVLA